MSYISVRSVSSGTCSNSSHWSTPAPLTPTYFPNPVENPLPPLKPSVEVNLTTYRADADDREDEDRLEIIADVDGVESTPKRTRQTTAQRTTQSPVSSSSPSPYDVATPSPSIHQYSSALRQTMRARYDEAFKRMNSGDGKMALDLSWEDEDPIDRHVRMSSLRQEAETRRRKAAASSSASQVLDGMPAESDPMLGKAGPSSRMLDNGLPPARPTLLDFRGYSHLNTSSFGSRSDEDAENGDNDDTPGSIASEASFEAGSKEDWVDMYGRSLSGDQLGTIPPVASATTATVPPPLESPNITFRMSQASISTHASNDTTSSQATVLPPRPCQSQREQQGRLNSFGIGPRPSPSPGLPYLQPCEHSPSHLFQPLPTPAPLSQLANGYFAIPTQPAPAPVSRSYPKRPTMGTRQRSRNHPYANALEKQRERDLSSIDINARPPVPVVTPVLACGTSDSQGEAHMYPERSESEMMVLLAGLRSQRSRAAART